MDRAYKLEGVRTKANQTNPEGVERFGLWKCGQKECRKQFTVRKGTIFEDSHCPLYKWLQAAHLMCSSKKGISAHQLHRILEVQYKTAWFIEHRLREAMRDGSLRSFGSGGGGVEVDETFIGRDKKKKPDTDNFKRGYQHKYKVLALVDRTTGQARATVVDDLKVSTLLPILKDNIAKEAKVYTDEAIYYAQLWRHFASHDFNRHNRGVYVSRSNPQNHTNTIEGYFSIFKRGMKGVYQHCSKKHLHRYVAEFEFRYNHRIVNGYDDTQRATAALLGVVGKRLTYRGPDAIC
jgi:transposase-like protein